MGLEIRRMTERLFSVSCHGEPVGRVELYANPFHGQNQYLRLQLSRYENGWAAPIFDQLRAVVRKPLQVMLSSEDVQQAAFLLAGGFACRRKCYEMKVSAKDCRSSLTEVPLEAAKTGQPEYAACCRLLYGYYRQTHAAVNPLTADFDAFCKHLPAEAFYGTEDGAIRHVAFVEENEIAYLGSTALETVLPFAEGVAARLLAAHETICFECDDCDAAAMALKGLFSVETHESYDTYLRE